MSQIGKNSSEEKVYDQAADEVSMMMTLLIQKYRHHTGTLAQVFADQLAAHVAIHAKQPHQVLAAISSRILKTDVATLQSDYRRWTLTQGTASAALGEGAPEADLPPHPTKG